MRSGAEAPPRLCPGAASGVGGYGYTIGQESFASRVTLVYSLLVRSVSEAERKIRMKAWVDNWKELAPILEAERFERIRSANTCESLLALEDLFNSAVWLHAPKPESGLVTQQAILMKSRA